MNQTSPEQVKQALIEQRRDWINSIFGLLRGLSMHDLKNEAVQRPIQQFEQGLGIFLEESQETPPVVRLKFEGEALSVNGDKLPTHFSIVEAMKWIPDCFVKANLEEVVFHAHVDAESWKQLFQKWALHCSVVQKPKDLVFQGAGIDIKFADPEKMDSRLKTKQVLLSNRHALQHYYVLRKLTTEFFQSVSRNEIPSLRRLRRELMEMIEISKVHPHQLLALSLLRAEKSDDDQALFETNASEAIATSLLTILMTRHFNFGTQDQLNLALVGLLYNVGLLSEELNKIIRSDAKLTQLEYRRVIDAQSKGVLKILRSEGVSRPGLVRLLSLFEASQASRKPSLAVSLESQMLRICSAYVAMTSDRPYRDAYLPAEAVKLLGSRAVGRGDHNHIETVVYYVFVRILGLYPFGSFVLLNNQTKGVIYRPHSQQRSRPLVRLLDEDGLLGEIVDLGARSDLEIVKALDPLKEGLQVSACFFE
jgi:hypothetical protein